MPVYKVIAPGFFKGEYYHPEGKRSVLHTDKPFTTGKKGKNPLPSWLIPMPKESEAVRKKREAQEVSQKAADEQKMADDLNEVNIASTEGDGAEASFLGKIANAVTGNNSNVETL